MQEIKRAYCFDDILLVPKKSVLSSRSLANISTKVCGLEIQIPFISANMSTITGVEFAIEFSRLGGLPALHRFFVSTEAHISAIEEVFENTKGPIGFSVGLKDWETVCNYIFLNKKYKDRAICFFDIAHAHSNSGLNFLNDFFAVYPNEGRLVFGNIGSLQASRDVANIMGSAAYRKIPKERLQLKASIGNGGACTTAFETGFSVPTLHALLTSNWDHELIADGGIKTSGDIVKSFWAGANAVMLGGLFAGTKETPGDIIEKDGKMVKIYRGSASFEDKKARNESESFHIEGVERFVPYKGSLESVVNKLTAGLRSGISYSGGTHLNDLLNVEAIEVSSNWFKRF